MIGIIRAYADYLLYPNIGLSRLVHPILYYVWFTLVGALIASRANPPPVALINVVFAIMATALCVYSFNDIKDMKIDKDHPRKSQRPLTSGKVTVKEVLSLSLISGFIGLSLALLNNVTTFILSAVYIVLGIAYSQQPIRLKERFILKEATTATGLFLAILMGGSAVGTITLPVIVAGTITWFYLFAFFPLFVDAEDVEVDRIHGYKTLAMVLEQRTMVEIAIGIVIAVMTLISLAYAQFGFNVICPIIVSTTCLLFLRCLFPLLTSQNNEKMLQAKKFYRLLAITMQASFILGSIVF